MPSSYQKIVFPEGATQIESHAFTDCPELSEISLPGSLTRIEDGSFDGCANLRKVLLSKGLKQIGSSAFASCKKLSCIDIPDTVEKIEFCAFKGCSKLSKVTLPERVHISSTAFEGTPFQKHCPNLFEIEDGILKHYMGCGGSVIIPDFVW